MHKKSFREKEYNQSAHKFARAGLGMWVEAVVNVSLWEGVVPLQEAVVKLPLKKPSLDYSVSRVQTCLKCLIWG